MSGDLYKDFFETPKDMLDHHAKSIGGSMFTNRTAGGKLIASQNRSDLCTRFEDMMTCDCSSKVRRAIQWTINSLVRSDASELNSALTTYTVAAETAPHSIVVLLSLHNPNCPDRPLGPYRAIHFPLNGGYPWRDKFSVRATSDEPGDDPTIEEMKFALKTVAANERQFPKTPGLADTVKRIVNDQRQASDTTN